MKKEGLDHMARVGVVSRLHVHIHSKRKSALLECIVEHEVATSELREEVP